MQDTPKPAPRPPAPEPVRCTKCRDTGVRTTPGGSVHACDCEASKRIAAPAHETETSSPIDELATAAEAPSLPPAGPSAAAVGRKGRGE